MEEFPSPEMKAEATLARLRAEDIESALNDVIPVVAFATAEGEKALRDYAFGTITKEDALGAAGVDREKVDAGIEMIDNVLKK